MSIWLTIPSKRPPEEAVPLLQKWRERGYKIALWLDLEDSHRYGSRGNWNACDWYLTGSDRVAPGYPGYAVATNELIRTVLDLEPACTFCVIGGDDVEPDPDHTAEEIERECSRYFAELNAGPAAAPGVALSVRSIRAALKGLELYTFGVMQPTGDRWGDEPKQPNFQGSAYVDRICGSAWIGREFALRVNQGNGPLWPEYTHMFVDEELQAIAEKYGVLWQRRDLTQVHHHWARANGGNPVGPPAFLKEANSPAHWNKYQALFNKRKAAGFPGSELK